MKKVLIFLLVLVFSLGLSSCDETLGSSSSVDTSSSIVSSTSSSSSISSSSSSSSSSTSSSSIFESSSSEINGSLPISVTHYLDAEEQYEYFIVDNSPASVERMKVPYLPDVVASYPDNYYDTAEGKTGSSLKSALASIASTVNYDYDWDRFEFCDEDPYNTDYIWAIYGGVDMSKSAHVGGSAGSGQWNREHTYPQSKFDKKNPMHGDTNHVFADDWKTNSVRSNKKYADLTNSTSLAVKDSTGTYTGCFSDSTYFEPQDSVKGQVARATLYMATRYADYNGTRLSITDNFKNLQTCLDWNDEFPPTSWEIYRNNKVYSTQGNRNPFIDHPEYADLIFAN